LIADIQALTTHIRKPSLIEDSVREVVLDWLAVGLDPTRPNVHFVLQSAIPELTELTTYFSMMVPFSEMEKNPTIKEELERLGSAPTAGFMIYPISQAADILLFTPCPPEKYDELLVPVGADQLPHLEGTNRIARHFNRRYGNVFLPCIPRVGAVGRLVGTDGQAKMSKSLGNAIQLKDSADTVRTQTAKMFTDPEKLRKGDPGRPELCPVYTYHREFGESQDNLARAEGCRSGQLGCVQCKQELADTLNDFLEPIRAKRQEAEGMDSNYFVQEGTRVAREIGGKTIIAVREAMHLDYKSVFGNSKI